VAVAEPAFTPAVVLDTTTRRSGPPVEPAKTAAPPPPTEETIYVPPVHPAVVKNVVPITTSKGGQGFVFALVAVAVICLLGMANAARKHKKELAVAETKSVAVQSAPAAASAAPAAKAIPPVQKAALVSSE